MGTDIFNIDASWAEKLMKKRVSFLTAPTVNITSNIYNHNHVIVLPIAELQGEKFTETKCV